ncbi:hypothetical protein COU58_03445 [Candidatus Pacearchaeota archaeon CG10_big_fil_rev_8_21_14_0_10_32_42]|nr:MAG: hypothetical protein COU58_03445 [Candidatus Pacearchaeota archaeon CG10_big_fil_rev_8_21_14_0_10_32_42]
MQIKGGLHKILDSVKTNIIIPIAGLILFSGCYSVVNVEKAEVRKVPYIYLRDSDRDGIPDIYDARPFIYDFPIRVGPHYPYHIQPWYHFPSDVKRYIKPKVKIKERTPDTRKLRNNNGERDPKRKR